LLYKTPAKELEERKRFAIAAAAAAREILTLYMYQKQDHPIFQANILVHIQDIEEVNNMIKTYAQVMQIFLKKIYIYIYIYKVHPQNDRLKCSETKTFHFN
jgi:hypothetical protein